MTATPWWAAAHRQFDLATGRVGLDSASMIIDGHRIELQMAGRAISRYFLPPFENHLTTEPGVPELTVRAWDSATTGVPFPVEDAAGRLAIPAWRVRRSTDEVPLDGLRIIDQNYEGAFGMLDGSRALYWSLDADHLPSWERAQPIMHLLHWWFASIGIQLIHSAAVARDGRGVLIVGRSGSGKSTTALSALSGGFDYVGDDRVLLKLGSTPRVLHLYATAKMVAEPAGPLGEFLPPVENPVRSEEEKALYVIRRGVALSCEVAAIVVPRIVDDRRASLEPIGPSTALAALAPSSIVGTPGAGARALGMMRELCDSVPCLQLRLGSPESVADVLGSLL